MPPIPFNIALGFDCWNGHVFGLIIKKDLKHLSTTSQQQPTLVNSVISQQLQRKFR
ncbi:20517_t:CDS:2 [Rhizophagus irregularis]|nr:20517_t:CDS:2 [Rhizophagus irregularis]